MEGERTKEKRDKNIMRKVKRNRKTEKRKRRGRYE